jgi:hypothetical protein
VFSPAREPAAQFTVDATTLVRGRKATFTAHLSPHARYTWLFGDGAEAHGPRATHTFADADGTELDGQNGAGRFRVLLHVEDASGRRTLPAPAQPGATISEPVSEDWAEQDLVAVDRWHEAVSFGGPTVAGLYYRIYPGDWTELPDLRGKSAVFADQAPSLQADARGFTRYAVAWEGFITVSADGGYTFYLTARDGARLVIDGMEVAKTGPPFAQVCGSPGNAVRFAVGSLGLRAGRHIIHLESLHSNSNDAPRLMWQAPGAQLVEVPSTAYTHPKEDVITKR